MLFIRAMGRGVCEINGFIFKRMSESSISKQAQSFGWLQAPFAFVSLFATVRPLYDLVTCLDTTATPFTCGEAISHVTHFKNTVKWRVICSSMWL